MICLRRFLLLSLGLSLFLPLFATPRAGGQEELYLRGNQLYQEGDFAGALEAYEAVREAGFESAKLHFNLGNAYFKTGELGRSILSYERALLLSPRDPDIQANLQLARSLTADAIEPLPRFWLLSALEWWVDLLPRRILVFLVVTAWLLGMGALCLRILSRTPRHGQLGSWVALGSGGILLLFGSTLLAREGVLGESNWGIVLAEEVAVQSAPSEEDDLTLFLVHEGTKVRIDQTTESWMEVVLEDGKVGWIPSDRVEII